MLAVLEASQAEYEGSIPFTRSNLFNNLEKSRVSRVSGVSLTVLVTCFGDFSTRGQSVASAVALRHFRGAMSR